MSEREREKEKGLDWLLCCCTDLDVGKLADQVNTAVGQLPRLGCFSAELKVRHKNVLFLYRERKDNMKVKGIQRQV